MQFFIFVLFLCFLVFLFSLYRLSKDDYVLLRHGLTLERMFNMAIIVSLSSLFFSRLIFAVLDGSMGFLNPLVFFLFPYFPGLSLSGGILGGLLTIAFLSRLKKFPAGRVLDFFAMSLLVALPLGYAGKMIIEKSLDYHEVFWSLLYLGLFFIFSFLVLPRIRKGEFEDGSLGYTILIIFSFSHILMNALSKTQKAFLFFGFSDIPLLVILAASLLLLFRGERERVEH